MSDPQFFPAPYEEPRQVQPWRQPNEVEQYIDLFGLREKDKQPKGKKPPKAKTAKPIKDPISPSEARHLIANLRARMRQMELMAPNAAGKFMVESGRHVGDPVVSGRGGYSGGPGNFYSEWVYEGGKPGPNTEYSRTVLAYNIYE